MPEHLVIFSSKMTQNGPTWGDLTFEPDGLRGPTVPLWKEGDRTDRMELVSLRLDIGFKSSGTKCVKKMKFPAAQQEL